MTVKENCYHLTIPQTHAKIWVKGIRREGYSVTFSRAQEIEDLTVMSTCLHKFHRFHFTDTFEYRILYKHVQKLRTKKLKKSFPPVWCFSLENFRLPITFHVHFSEKKIRKNSKKHL